MTTVGQSGPLKVFRASWRLRLSLSLSLSLCTRGIRPNSVYGVYIYIYIYVCVCVCIYIYIYIFMFLSMRIIDMCSQDAGVDVLLFKRGFNTSQNLE